MTKRQHIKELEAAAAKYQSEINSLKCQLDVYKIKFEKFTELNNTMPEECKRGLYCDACMYQRTLHYNDGSFSASNRRTMYLCGKGMVCPGFAERVKKGE